MASDKASASDGGDNVIQDVPDFHKEYMKAKLIDFLRETKDFSVQIIHSRDKPAQMIFNIGTKAGNFCIYFVRASDGCHQAFEGCHQKANAYFSTG